MYMCTCTSKCHMIHRQPKLRKEWRWMMKRGEVCCSFTVRNKNYYVSSNTFTFVHFIFFWFTLPRILIIICCYHATCSWSSAVKLSQIKTVWFHLVRFLMIEFNLVNLRLCLSDYNSVITRLNKINTCMYCVGWSIHNKIIRV